MPRMSFIIFMSVKIHPSRSLQCIWLAPLNYAGAGHQGMKGPLLLTREAGQPNTGREKWQTCTLHPRTLSTLPCTPFLSSAVASLCVISPLALGTSESSCQHWGQGTRTEAFLAHPRAPLPEWVGVQGAWG